MKTLTINDIERISFELAQGIMSFNEPIPEFSTRFPYVLESCISAPFQTFGNKSLYPDLIAKAAVLFYLMIKNHPFQNGNKRIAMTTLFVFLHMNNKWIEVDTKELYNFTMWIAESNARLKSETIKAIEKFLKLYVVKLS